MSTQKELVKQKLDLLTKAPHEFVVVSYNLSVPSEEIISDISFYNNSEFAKNKMSKFKSIISPLPRNVDTKEIENQRNEFYERLASIYHECYDDFKNFKRLDFMDNLDEQDPMQIMVFNGLVIMNTLKNPALEFSTKQNAPSLQEILKDIETRTSRYLDSQEESENE